jgi:hypothetical protein
MDGHACLYYQTSIMTYFWQQQSVTRVVRQLLWRIKPYRKFLRHKDCSARINPHARQLYCCQTPCYLWCCCWCTSISMVESLWLIGWVNKGATSKQWPWKELSLTIIVFPPKNCMYCSCAIIHHPGWDYNQWEANTTTCSSSQQSEIKFVMSSYQQLIFSKFLVYNADIIVNIKFLLIEDTETHSFSALTYLIRVFMSGIQ